MRQVSQLHTVGPPGSSWKGQGVKNLGHAAVLCSVCAPQASALPLSFTAAPRVVTLSPGVEAHPYLTLEADRQIRTSPRTAGSRLGIVRSCLQKTNLIGKASARRNKT